MPLLAIYPMELGSGFPFSTCPFSNFITSQADFQHEFIRQVSKPKSHARFVSPSIEIKPPPSF
ncbi:hypothetical protein YWY31_38790 [Paenibacillus illinoisensis]